MLQRFPEEARLIRRLYLCSREFRSICEDHATAQTTLAHFRTRVDAAERPEVAEYEDLIRELEAELADALEATRGPPNGAASAGPDARRLRPRGEGETD